MFLPLSAVLFSLVALELSATIRKSTEEGHIAFLVSRIQSSKPQMLAQKIQGPLAARDNKTLHLLLMEGGVKAETESNLRSLQALESSLVQDFQRQYDRILYYLSDDLKEFFGKCKILWDVENLKMLLCYVLDGKRQQKCVNMVGPFGYLDAGAIESLEKSNTAEELINNSAKMLPVEFSSRLVVQDWSSTMDIEFALDLAAFAFLQITSKEMGTWKTRMVWDFMDISYELQNLITMGRFKLSKMPSENIESFLFPSSRRLDRSEYTSLLESANYPSFLRILRRSYYGKWLSDGDVDPKALEDRLRKAVLDIGSERATIEMSKVACFLAELEMHYETIRKAAFLVAVKALDEE